MKPRTLSFAAVVLLITTLVSSTFASSGNTIYLPLVNSTGPAAAPVDPPFQELDWARTAYSRMAVGEQDGRLVARIQRFSTPVDFYDAPTDRWLPIDTTIVPAVTGYRNAAADFQVNFATGGAAPALSDRGPPLLTLSRPTEPDLRVRLPEGTIPTPQIATNQITYPAAVSGVDLVYTVEPWGIKEEFVLTDANAPTSYTLLLDLGGASVQVAGAAGWIIQDGNGRTLWRMLPPLGTDANGVTTALNLTFTPDADGSYRTVLSVDPAWLSDPARAFPVRLDPSFANPQYIGGETYVQSIESAMVSYNQRARYLGYSTSQGLKGFNRIYSPIDLSVLPDGLPEDQLLNVQLVLSQYVTESAGAGFASSVHAVPSAWSDLTLTWNNQPAQGERISGTVVSPVLEQKRWDVTSWAQDVLAGRRSNHGVMIRADNETGTGDGAGIFWSSLCGIFCTNPALERPFVEYTIALDSGLNPWLDTWAWPNRSGVPSFEQFVRDYGLDVTTHLITETQVLQTFSSTEVISLPVSFEPIDLTLSIPLSSTNALSATESLSESESLLIPRPIAYAYESVLVKAVFDDQFADAVVGTMEGGLCLGMVGTVADFHREDGPLPAEYGGDLTVQSIPDAEAAQEYIQTIHGRQLGSQAMNWLATPGQGQLSVTAYYNRLLAQIGSDAWRTNPEILGIIRGAGCEQLEIGHALLPYKLVLLPNSQARVYVYDPNHPPTSADDAANRFLLLDLANNTWSYNLAPGVDWVGQTLYSTPLSLLLEQPILPTMSGTDAIMVSGGHSMAFGGHSMAFGGHSMAFGEDGMNTHTGCYVNASGQVQLTQEISRSYRIVPLNGFREGQSFPYTLFMPAGQPLSFNGYGSRASGVADMLIFGPQAMAGALGTAGSTSRDRLAMDATFHRATLSTQDASKPVTLYQLHEDAVWTRVYALSNTELALGEALILEVSPDHERMTVINRAPRDKRFDLGLGHIGSDGYGQVTYPDQTIEAGATIIYTPLPWNRLPAAPIMVEIDVDSDGRIDRVELLGGTLLPIVAPETSVPTTAGATFEVLTEQVRAAPGDRGWVAPQWLLSADQVPTRAMNGNNTTLQAWLSDPALIRLQLGDQLVGVPGTHGGLIRSISAPLPDPEGLSLKGQIVVVPLYTHIVMRRGGLPNTYPVTGFAVARVVASDAQGGEDDACRPQSDCRKRLRLELIFTYTP